MNEPLQGAYLCVPNYKDLALPVASYDGVPIWSHNWKANNVSPVSLLKAINTVKGLSTDTIIDLSIRSRFYVERYHGKSAVTTLKSALC
jgi:hypothetical protein